MASSTGESGSSTNAKPKVIRIRRLDKKETTGDSNANGS
ncbi:MAG: hypothetical protein JWL99_4001 [Streptomyces oryziradicis]|jgi:hypothetical protein|nr:hypothetical protein [Actinacidiphila oryziradicis]